jgi:uncharacterized membrane protein
VQLWQFFLFLHVLGAIAAFGPGFAAMIVGPMVAKEPQHANFYARTQVASGKRLVTPVALSMAVTGILILLTVPGGYQGVVGSRLWLPVGIVLYIVAVAFAFLWQARNGDKLVELTSAPPAPGSPPNPEIPATAGKLRTGGIVLTLLVIAIVFLMVTKPF